MIHRLSNANIQLFFFCSQNGCPRTATVISVSQPQNGYTWGSVRSALKCVSCDPLNWNPEVQFPTCNQTCVGPVRVATLSILSLVWGCTRCPTGHSFPDILALCFSSQERGRVEMVTFHFTHVTCFVSGAVSNFTLSSTVHISAMLALRQGESFAGLLGRFVHRGLLNEGAYCGLSKVLRCGSALTFFLTCLLPMHTSTKFPLLSPPYPGL